MLCDIIRSYRTAIRDTGTVGESGGELIGEPGAWWR